MGQNWVVQVPNCAMKNSKCIVKIKQFLISCGAATTPLDQAKRHRWYLIFLCTLSLGVLDSQTLDGLH